MKDNLGNTLTKEQENYFRNSKIKDSSGNLLVCYHGTETPGFKEFDARQGKSQFGNYKFGNYNVNYFTTDKEVAIGYTDIGIEQEGNVYACYLNIVNPFIVDNKTEADMRKWSNIKDETVRKKELATFNKFYSKWSSKNITIDDLEELNKDLFYFNCAFEPNDEDESYFDLVDLGSNTMFGSKHPIMYAYSLEDYFDRDQYEEFRDALIGDIDNYEDDYFYTIDNLIKWVILMNEEDGTNYDGIIIPDISDIGPKGSPFMTANTTDIVTLGSSNQIKSITNKNPTASSKIDEGMIVSQAFDMYATQSVYEAKNFLLNHNESWRVFIDEHIPLYLIGRPYECTHTNMVELAQFTGYDTKIDDFDKKIVCAIYSIKDEYNNPEITDHDAQSDDYEYSYWWDNCVMYSRYNPLSDFELYKVMKQELGTPSKMKLHEELLTEKTRQDLISKSRSGKNYSKKNQAKGKNRWERRIHSRISNSVRDYNRIDMDAFFKGDILDFTIKVQGETDNYEVVVTFENILNELRQEVKQNNNKLEFKCVLRALLKAFNSGNVYISCSCPDFKYRFAYHATQDGYNIGRPEDRPNRFVWTNSADDMGSACKHVNLVISNLDWMMKIASVINNYIKWCRDNMERNYADYIFPVVYGMPYDKAVQLSLFDKEDIFGDGILPSDKQTLDDVINKSLRGKDASGRWQKGNEYRFEKKPKRDTSQEDENALNLKFGDEDKVSNKNKRLVVSQEEEEEEN